MSFQEIGFWVGMTNHHNVTILFSNTFHVVELLSKNEAQAYGHEITRLLALGTPNRCAISSPFVSTVVRLSTKNKPWRFTSFKSASIPFCCPVNALPI